MTDIPRLPDRPADGHKGTFGRVVCVGGSRGMAGSIALSAMAALRSGAGLVTAAVPDRILETVAAFEPALMTRPLDCDLAGRVTLAAADDALSLLESADAAVIGPGLSRSDLASSFARQIVAEAGCPLVVDADALNALAEADLHFGDRVRVLTPHPGEMATLSGATISAVQAERRGVAKTLARRLSAVVVLKGAGTIITDGDRTTVNESGNSGMATAGTGDVLAGMIAAVMAAGVPAWEAARLSAHVHGSAGDVLAARHSKTGLTSTELCRVLPEAWAAFET